MAGGCSSLHGASGSGILLFIQFQPSWEIRANATHTLKIPSHSPVPFCFSLCWPAGWEGEMRTSWFPPSPNLFLPSTSSLWHLPGQLWIQGCQQRCWPKHQSGGFSDPNMRVVETKAHRKALQLAEGSRNQGSFPKIVHSILQKQPTTIAPSTPTSCWCPKAPQLYCGWGYTNDLHQIAMPCPLSSAWRQPQNRVNLKSWWKSFWINCSIWAGPMAAYSDILSCLVQQHNIRAKRNQHEYLLASSPVICHAAASLCLITSSNKFGEGETRMCSYLLPTTPASRAESKKAWGYRKGRDFEGTKLLSTAGCYLRAKLI